MPGAASHQVVAVAPAPAVANQVQLTPSLERYSLKPSAVFALLAQVRLTWLPLTATAASLLGAAGLTARPDWEPVSDAAVVSVALTDWAPAVLRVALKVCTPASVAVKA